MIFTCTVRVLYDVSNYFEKNLLLHSEILKMLWDPKLIVNVAQLCSVSNIKNFVFDFAVFSEKLIPIALHSNSYMLFYLSYIGA